MRRGASAAIAAAATPTRCTGEDTGGSRGYATERVELEGKQLEENCNAGCLNRHH